MCFVVQVQIPTKPKLLQAKINLVHITIEPIEVSPSPSPSPQPPPLPLSAPPQLPQEEQKEEEQEAEAEGSGVREGTITIESVLIETIDGLLQQPSDEVYEDQVLLYKNYSELYSKKKTHRTNNNLKHSISLSLSL